MTRNGSCSAVDCLGDHKMQNGRELLPSGGHKFSRPPSKEHFGPGGRDLWGRAGKVANGITVVYLSYVHEGPGWDRARPGRGPAVDPAGAYR